MAYVKYTPEQIAERERAQKAIKTARAHLKALRDEKRAAKEGVATLRRELKAEIKRRKEAKIEAKKAEKEEKKVEKEDAERWRKMEMEEAEKRKDIREATW